MIGLQVIFRLELAQLMSPQPNPQSPLPWTLNPAVLPGGSLAQGQLRCLRPRLLYRRRASGLCEVASRVTRRPSLHTKSRPRTQLSAALSTPALPRERLRRLPAHQNRFPPKASLGPAVVPLQILRCPRKQLQVLQQHRNRSVPASQHWQNQPLRRCRLLQASEQGLLLAP